MSNKLIVAYEKNFKGREIPALLIEMLQHEEWHNESEISQCFYCSDEDSDEFFDMYFSPEDKSWLDQFIHIGQADGTGARYAFFIANDQLSVEDNPIVFIGSEGETNLAASNFKEFLQLLSIGPEPMGGHSIDESLSFYVDEDDLDDIFNYITYRDDFISWLTAKEIEPITVDNYEEKSDEIIKRAEDQYKDQFVACLKKAGWEL